MKKLFILLLAVALLFVGCSSSGEEEPAVEDESSMSVALITPEKIGANQFFTLMVDGVTQAGEDLGVNVTVIESADPSAIEENLRVAVAEDYDLIIAASYNSEDAIVKVAEENPDKSFAIMDTFVDHPNVRSAVFREQEAAFLMGAAAGLSTESNTVGMVVAMDIPLLSKWVVGYEEGLHYVNPDAELLVNYVGGFTDPAKAKELALLQYSKGADFIAGASALGDTGIFEAAAEKGFYTSGQDIDWTSVNPEHIVLSQLKRMDTVAYETVKIFVEGNFENGMFDYGLAENGVGVTYITHDTESPLSPFIGEETVDAVREIRDDIVAGNIVVTNPLAN